jgi:UDP-2,4-diacetamido-2,4,6-trideoxy-beta-L-altropyranose hydrolase
MRCLALAQACQDAGGTAEFLSAPLPLALHDRLRAEGIVVRGLEHEPGSRADAKETARVARESEATWVVADGYEFDHRFEATIKQAGLRLLMIDDVGHARKLCADVVLNQNPQATENLYQHRATETDLLLGSRFALLRREFLSWRTRRRHRHSVRRLLVTLGGADPENVTLKTIRALLLLRSPQIEVIVVVGPANAHRADLEAAIGEMDCPIELKDAASNMPELMDWADCAISAAGSTCWELAFMGVPNLLIVLAENQRGGAEALEALNVSRNLGCHADLHPEGISMELERFFRANETRESMSENGRLLIDGTGAARVVEALRMRTLTLRTARGEDCDLLYRWVNEAAVRRVSFASEQIAKEDHVRWFSGQMHDSRSLLFIACDATENPVGQIRFALESEGATEATVSVSVALEKRGVGLGQRLIRLGVEKVTRETPIRTVHALVKLGNHRSISAFEKAGFANCGETMVNGQPAVHLIQHAKQMDSPARSNLPA